MNPAEQSPKSVAPPVRNFLGAVVCPLTPRELPAALANFKIWADSAPPSRADRPRSVSQRPRLVFSFNCAPDPALVAPLEDAFRRHAIVKDSFSDIDIRFCNLPPEKDLYIRNPVGKAPKFGNKSGPNWLFYETMMALRSEMKFVFLMETDCTPIAPNWLIRLEIICSQNQDAWVLGSQYCGASPLHWSLARHINGNAIYQVGDPAFTGFLEDFFWPWMHRYISERDPNLAYDCAWETFLNRQEMEHPGHYDWIRSRSLFQRFRLSNFIVNIAGHAEQTGQYRWTKKDVLNRYPGAVIVHGPLSKGADYVRGGMALGKPWLGENASMKNSQLLYRGTTERNPVKFERTVWLPGQAVERDDTLSVELTVVCAKTEGVTVEICDPSGTVLGRKSLLGLQKGVSRRDKFVFTAQDAFAYLNIRLRFNGPTDEGAEIFVSDCLVTIQRGTENVLARTKWLLD